MHHRIRFRIDTKKEGEASMAERADTNRLVDGMFLFTEFILISPGQGAGTTLDYYDDDGALADFSD